MMMGRFVFLQNVSAAQPEPSALAAACANSFLNRSKVAKGSDDQNRNIKHSIRSAQCLAS
jgi:hypothetical protein